MGKMQNASAFPCSWLKWQVHASAQARLLGPEVSLCPRTEAQHHSGHLCPQTHIVPEKAGGDEPGEPW